MSVKVWYNVELPMQYANLFKYYLRENDIYFEPSEAGHLIHIECLMTKEELETANSFLELIRGAEQDT